MAAKAELGIPARQAPRDRRRGGGRGPGGAAAGGGRGGAGGGGPRGGAPARPRRCGLARRGDRGASLRRQRARETPQGIPRAGPRSETRARSPWRDMSTRPLVKRTPSARSRRRWRIGPTPARSEMRPPAPTTRCQGTRGSRLASRARSAQPTARAPAGLAEQARDLSVGRDASRAGWRAPRRRPLAKKAGIASRAGALPGLHRCGRLLLGLGGAWTGGGGATCSGRSGAVVLISLSGSRRARPARAGAAGDGVASGASAPAGAGGAALPGSPTPPRKRPAPSGTGPLSCRGASRTMTAMIAFLRRSGHVGVVLLRPAVLHEALLDVRLGLVEGR